MKEREAALAERLPPLNLSGLSLQELMVFHFIRLFFSQESQLFLFKFMLLYLIPLEGVIDFFFFFTGSLQRLVPKD